MQLDDPNFCVGTYVSQQLANDCGVQQMEALLAQLQKDLAENRATSACLVSERGVVEGQEELRMALQEIRELEHKQEETKELLAHLDEQFATLHLVRSDLEFLDHAQEYADLLAEVEGCATSLTQQLQQASQHGNNSSDAQKLTLPDFALQLQPMCKALRRVETALVKLSRSHDLRKVLSMRIEHLFASFEPALHEIAHTLLKAAGWPHVISKASVALLSALQCVLLTQKLRLQLVSSTTTTTTTTEATVGAGGGGEARQRREEEEEEEEADGKLPPPSSSSSAAEEGKRKEEPMKKDPLLELLIEPVTLRFRFHFSDKQASNRVDKPEWISTYLLKVISDHSKFLSEVVQPIVDGCEMHRVILDDFIRGIYAIARAKFERQLTQLIANPEPALFRHIADELVGFEKRIQDLHYPTPGPVDILTKASLFKRWLAVNKQAMEEALEQLRSLPRAWEALNQNVESKRSRQESGKILATVAGDAFLAMLVQFSNRCFAIPNLDLRLRFLEAIELKAVERFFQHLAETIEETMGALRQNKPEPWQTVCGALGTVHSVIVSLSEWGESENFLELALHRAKAQALERGQNFTDNSTDFPTIFEESLQPYRELLRDAEQRVVEVIVFEFQGKCVHYQLSDDEGEEVSLGEALLSLKWQLSQLEVSLGGPSSVQLLRSLAFRLDQFLFTVVSDESPFTQQVAARFVGDVQALWRLFPRGEQLFPLLRDTATLLAMPLGEFQKLTAHLANLSSLDHRGVLAAHSVFKMTQAQVTELCSRVIAMEPTTPNLQ